MSSSAPINPDQINTMFTTACEAHMEGRLKEAKQLYHELLSFIDAPLLHYNLGLVYYDSEEYLTALEHFENAVKGDPNDMDSLFNLALCNKKCSRINVAIELFKILLTRDTDNIDAIYNLAGCYREIRHDSEAIEAYLKVLKLSPDHSSATSNLAYMYHLTRQTDLAIQYFEKLLILEPNHEAAKHMLASLQGDTPEAPPESYVKEVFDNYSERYEKSLLEELNYSVPNELRKCLDSTIHKDNTFTSGLDLGCGTGLSGEAFTDIIASFEGIDLSEKMIEVAREKNIYSALYSGNIVDYLKSTNQKYDFFIAADVFIYLGDLKDVFSSAKNIAAENAVFCFSTESTEESSFQLQLSGRFAHSPQYITEIVKETGWNVILKQQANLRKEKGQWITGVLWILRN